MLRENSQTWRLFAATTAAGLVMVLTGVAAVTAAGIGAAVSDSSSEGVSARGTVAKNAQGKMKSTVKGKTSDGGTLGGTFTPLKFKKKDGVPKVKGVIDGVIEHPNGTKTTFTAVRSLEVEKINGQKLARMTVSGGQMSQCDILNLVLGPLDLNVLGLEVHLNRVVLDIIAVPGPGNLLGNLLCAIAGLLDPPGPLGGLLSQLIDILNDILDALALGI